MVQLAIVCMRNANNIMSKNPTPIPQWWRKWKWSRIHMRIRITTKSQSLLEGHPLPTLAKFGRCPFPYSSVILFTEWQTERSHNIRLIGGGNNNKTSSFYAFIPGQPRRAGIWLSRKLLVTHCHHYSLASYHI